MNLKRIVRRLSYLRYGVTLGFCPICEQRTVFYQTGTWLRDQLLCAKCFSIPRQRALISVLQSHFPNWRELKIHESSPGGVSSDKILRESINCVQTQWFPDVPLGSMHHGFRCENLEQQTFEDASFDLVISQDVFEHVLNPDRGFAEIARTLKPNGAHVFTVPWYYWKATLVRAKSDANGTIQHLEPADYHKNPIDPQGSLVITEWGWDLADFIYRHSGLTTTAVRIHNPKQGINAEFIEVFISRKG